MNKKTITKAIFTAFVMCCFSTSSFAGDTADMAFGTSALKEMRPIQKKDGECMSFEASFSEPLGKEPLARLDIVNQSFANLLNAFLEVTKISDQKYRFALTAKTNEGCPKLEDENRLTISTYSVKDENGTNKQAQPSEVTFKAEKKSDKNKTIVLKQVKDNN